MQIKAKIVTYDTTLTVLKVSILTDDNLTLDCFVDDAQVGKAFQMESVTEFKEMTLEISDGYNWITKIF